MPAGLPQKVRDQMARAGLPMSGPNAYHPRLMTNRAGDQVIQKLAVAKGPKKGKKGYVDDQGRIWIKDHAYGSVPDHWDVQIDNGEDYIRVDFNGDLIPHQAAFE